MQPYFKPTYVTTKVSNLLTCGTAIKIANTVTNLLCTVEIKQGNIVQCNDCNFSYEVQFVVHL